MKEERSRQNKETFFLDKATERKCISYLAGKMTLEFTFTVKILSSFYVNSFYFVKIFRIDILFISEIKD